MSGDFGELPRGTFRRFAASRISPLTWALLVGTSVAGVYFELWQDLLVEPYGEFIQGVFNAVFGTALVALMFYSYWRLTREVSDLNGDYGAVWPWFGWTLVAYMPVVIVVAIVATWSMNHSTQGLLAESLFIAALPALTVVLLVHASGCAIAGENSDLGQIWVASKPHVLALICAFAALTVPFALVSELALQIGGNTVFPDALAVILYLPGSILSTILTVEAFHRVHQKAQG